MATLPSYFQMCVDAIVSLKEPTGSPQTAISNFICEKYKSHLPPNFEKLLSAQLKRLVKQKKLVKAGTSYKLPDVVKKSAPKAPKATKVTKAPKPKKAKTPKAPKSPKQKPNVSASKATAAPSKSTTPLRASATPLVVKPPKSVKMTTAKKTPKPAKKSPKGKPTKASSKKAKKN